MKWWHSNKKIWSLKKIQDMGHRMGDLDLQMEILSSRFSQVPAFLNSFQIEVANDFKSGDDIWRQRLQKVDNEIKSLRGGFVANLQQMEKKIVGVGKDGH